MAKLTEQRTYELADVTAYPDEVAVTMPKIDVNLTPDQARALGNLLIEAADLAPFLDWKAPDDNEHYELIDIRTQEVVTR